MSSKKLVEKLSHFRYTFCERQFMSHAFRHEHLCYCDLKSYRLEDPYSKCDSVMNWQYSCLLSLLLMSIAKVSATPPPYVADERLWLEKRKGLSSESSEKLIEAADQIIANQDECSRTQLVAMLNWIGESLKKKDHANDEALRVFRFIVELQPLERGTNNGPFFATWQRSAQSWARLCLDTGADNLPSEYLQRRWQEAKGFEELVAIANVLSDHVRSSEGPVAASEIGKQVYIRIRKTPLEDSHFLSLDAYRRLLGKNCGITSDERLGELRRLLDEFESGVKKSNQAAAIRFLVGFESTAFEIGKNCASEEIDALSDRLSQLTEAVAAKIGSDDSLDQDARDALAVSITEVGKNFRPKVDAFAEHREQKATLLPAKVIVGRKVPTIERNLKLGEISLDDGAVSLIYFWHTTCAPCIASIEKLSKLDDSYEDGFRVIGVVNLPYYEVNKSTGEVQYSLRASKESRMAGLKYLFEQKWHGQFPLIVDENSEVKEFYEIQSFPTAILVDGSGVVHGVSDCGEESFSQLVISIGELVRKQ